MDAILRRRSIRQYTQDPVPEDLITKILEAAMSAPSARNERPWHFIVVTEKDMLATLSDVSPYSKMTKEAAAAILVCGDLECETAKGFWVQDCAAATENLLIAVEALHLGAVWLGIYPREERVEYLRKALHVPPHVVPFALVPLGYPAETKTTPSRYDASRVHYNQW
ncbi:nitroreductase family protein [candidate division KSB3 bacterium]|uniref:Nitroreductase family protein n=1 Tax=candidate division KSB3 bacterium TaxID=2044937 RepID=A0A9D5JVG7_9BACT|nr:nitroreductase family protein [candidate division KSB3 bacterium]MBD3325014.1 nitroreductase family protein [candidate division KSB3 bacterium]